MYAIYAFCRMVDDMADEPANSDQAATTGSWRERVAGLYRESDGPVTRVLVAAVARFGLRQEDFVAVIDGMQMDGEASSWRPTRDARPVLRSRRRRSGAASVRAFGDASPAADRWPIRSVERCNCTNILREWSKMRIGSGFTCPVNRSTRWRAACSASRSEGSRSGRFPAARGRAGASNISRQPTEAMRGCDVQGDETRAEMASDLCRDPGRLEHRGWSRPHERVRLPKWQKLWLALRYGALR